METPLFSTGRLTKSSPQCGGQDAQAKGCAQLGGYFWAGTRRLNVGAPGRLRELAQAWNVQIRSCLQYAHLHDDSHLIPTSQAVMVPYSAPSLDKAEPCQAVRCLDSGDDLQFYPPSSLAGQHFEL
jgi:hypothetical protein